MPRAACPGMASGDSGLAKFICADLVEVDFKGIARQGHDLLQ